MRFFGWMALVFAVTLLWEGGALAESGAPASPLQQSGAAVECPDLTRVKYPFLSCAKAEFGTVVVFGGSPTILPTREMPALDPYVESAEDGVH